jgi:hypothetical protein
MLKFKAFLFNFICFAILFVGFRYLLIELTTLSTLISTLLAAVFSMILSPKFASVETDSGYKLFVKVPFVKGVKEL